MILCTSHVFIVCIYDLICYLKYTFSHAASYQSSPGAKNESDPNNTTVGTSFTFSEISF